jgi:tight adherence protein B
LLDTIAADVRGGTSLTTAMSAASRRCALTGRALTPRTVLTEVDRLTTTDPHEAVAVQAISAAAQLGGPVAATLHSGATMLRERAAVRAETLAHSAQARLSARVLTGVPLAFAAWSLVASGSLRTAIVSPAGLTAAALGVGCNLLGWWWMRRLIDRAAS